MFAGIVNFDNQPIVSSEKEELRNSLSRYKNEKIIEIDKPNAYFVRANTKALSNYDGVYASDNNIVSLMAGEPLIPNEDNETSHSKLANVALNNEADAFRNVRGVFALASYDTSALTLNSDKLGIRPLYYWQCKSTVIFSTSLRVLEEISFVPKEGDDTALAEMIAFDFPLADRTPYKGIKQVRESEIVRFTKEGSTSQFYWRWDAIKQSKLTKKRSTQIAYELFLDSVNVRLNNDNDALAFLSGGMDSRAIIGALHHEGIQVQAFNFSPSNSQDQEFARKFASEIGTPYSHEPRDQKTPLGFRVHLANLVSDHINNGKMQANRPQAFWSGDGGSVSLGSVYLDEKMLELMRAEKIEDAIKYYRKFNHIDIPLKAMNEREASKLAKVIDTGIMSELSRLKCDDPAQALFLFLMFNDQRRHLNDVFEELDLHRMEYQLPFFDSKLLEFIFSLPLDYRILHRFYDDWFKEFPSEVTQVPWQTYPGHVACHLPIDETLSYQWSRGNKKLLTKIREAIPSGLKGISLALSEDNIGPISKSKLLITSLVHLTGLRSYRYILNAAELYKKYLN